MKQSNTIPVFALFVISGIALAGCELIAGIFKAGFVVGIAAVGLVLALIVWLFIRILS